MTYEEYFHQNPKARLVAKVMLDSLDKQASMKKSAVNWGSILDTLRGGYGKIRRGIGRIGEGARIGRVIGDANAEAKGYGKIRTLLEQTKGAGRGGWANAKGEISKAFDTAQDFALKHPYATTAAGIGVGAATGTSGLGMTMMHMRDKKQQQKKAASVQIPPAMRVMAHIMDGNYEWIAKMAACCKKNGKCSKVEHKQMPGK